MGSQGGSHDEITVLVTGFGPFRAQYPTNPSWEIARDLPEYLPPRRAKDPNARHDAVDIPEVRILVHPEPIRVSYQKVRQLVPSFWGRDHHGKQGDDGLQSREVTAEHGYGPEGQTIDAAIHIGMAGPRLMYQIERRGHRQGYRSKDVDGKLLDDEAEGAHGSDWIWYGCPDELETELDMVDVHKRWQASSPDDLDLRISDDAGRYLCDFIYYSSLAHLWKQQRPRKVVFFHVPAEATERNVAIGKELVLNLVRAIVESEVTRRRGGWKSGSG